MGGAVDAASAMLFYVKHSDNETTAFNANCKNIVLLSYIKQCFGIENAIDLISADPAKVSDPKTVPLNFCDDPDKYAHETAGFSERGKFAVVSFTTGEEGRMYTVHLNSEEGQKLKTLVEALNASKAGGKAGVKAGGKGKK